ncbi:hypothetical protein A1359_20280 [Methylomonas lenta]|uniref:Type I restriction modification DNA specificity domain-containing protein n=1 Tax=Methylomonas lenta TaxID=980561 RepID=A0A177NRX0_9GAMM|nr:restriction endonuclease subunit S [Methylomonas lenta]OAI20827.1 hypothetical protein A1359_20280 [Methylomonas lenta]
MLQQLIIDHIDLWTSAETSRSTAGRGSNGKTELTGIKKLRELILELAVRGLLVPQDPNDEPASVLVEKIKPLTKKIAKDGKFSEYKLVDNKETPYFEIPVGWKWCVLGEIAAIARGGSPRPIKSFITEDEDGLNWIKIGDSVRGSRFIISTEQKIKPEGLTKTREVFPGDLILSNSMSFGYPYILKISGCIHDGWLVLRIPEHLMNKIYLCNLFTSPYAKQAFTASAAGAVVQNLNSDKVKSFLLPLPPLAEQHRIVAKVDELMALCDQLEQQQLQQSDTHHTLVTTLLDSLRLATDNAQFQAIWSQLAAHFDTLFTTEASIDQLKQTLLQLAVMGKLVPQDPNDEPASVLLEKIAAEKAQLIKDGKIKNQKPLPEITEDEKPFRLPDGWEWTRFENIVEISSGVTKGRKLTGKNLVLLPYLRVANVQRSYLDLEVIKDIEITEDEIDRFILKERDLLITEGGDWDKVGRTAIWHLEIPLCIHQNHIFKARCILVEQNEHWLEKYLNSYIARVYFAGASKQTTNLASINKTQLSRCPIPMPPLAEQHRIVAKVDELMALCDQLKAGLNQAQTTQHQLAHALVEQAIQ